MRRYVVFVAILLVASVVGSVGAAPALAQPTDSQQPATLDVEQPSFIDSDPSIEEADNRTIYTVKGAEHTLTPRNFNVSNISSATISEDGGQIELDARAQRYDVTVDSAGTYEVVFTAQTPAGPQRYVAVLDVTRVDYVHLSSEQAEARQEKADAYDTVRDAYEEYDLISEDDSISQANQVMEEAAVLTYFVGSPLAGLIRDFVLFGTLFGTRPAGWMLLSAVLLAVSLTSAFALRRYYKMKRKLPDIDDMDQSKRQAEARERERNLALQPFQELGFTDHDTQAVKEHFNVRNPRQAASKLQETWGMLRFVRSFLSAHAQNGDSVRVHRNDTGDVVGAELVTDRDGASAGDGVATDGSGRPPEATRTETIALADHDGDLDDDIVYALDWTAFDSSLIFDDHIDPAKLDLPVGNSPDDDDLISEMEIPIGEDGDRTYHIERREEFAELWASLLGELDASTWTDDAGRPRPGIDFLEFMVTWTTHGAERFRLPVGDIRDLFLRARQHHDAGERLDDLAKRSRDNNLAVTGDGGD
jgi:hypothetical protein